MTNSPANNIFLALINVFPLFSSANLLERASYQLNSSGFINKQLYTQERRKYFSSVSCVLSLYPVPNVQLFVFVIYVKEVFYCFVKTKFFPLMVFAFLSSASFVFPDAPDNLLINAPGVFLHFYSMHLTLY